MDNPSNGRLRSILSSLWDRSAEGEPIPRDEADRRMREDFAAWRTANSMQEKHYDVDRAWTLVRRRIRIRSVRRIAFASAGCAAALGFALLALPLSQRGTHDDPPGIAAECRGPKVLLRFADGQTVDLGCYSGTKEASGAQVVNDLGQGAVVYRSPEAAPEQQSRFNSLITAKGGEYRLDLPDGSVVWLNSESSLRFPVRFAADRREVYLDGEAYFRIAHDASAPFHVHIPECDICVLGTSFNVSAYGNDPKRHATLVEGSLRIDDSLSSHLLKPGEQYALDKASGVSTVQPVDPELYTSWVEGKFYFSAAPFEEIARILERWYDFRVEYLQDEIRRMRFSGTIHKHRPLIETLNYIEKTTRIHFRIEGRKVVVSRT